MKHFICILLVAAALSGCATHKSDDATRDTKAGSDVTSLNAGSQKDGLTPAEQAELDGIFLDDSAFDAGMPESSPIPDPLEGWNRMWFSFNDFFLLKVIKPVYNGYDAIMPDALQSGLSNALHNLQAPIRIVNSLLQFEFAQAVVEFGRFMVNTTVGGLGLAEVVKPSDALVPINLETANFSGTLAKWGVGEGIYLVWPVLGPSTLRDTGGLAGDWMTSVSFWVSEPIGSVNAWASYGVDGALQFNSMGAIIAGYETLTKSAIEPYSAVRDAYIKLRRSQLIRPMLTARPALD